MSPREDIYWMASPLLVEQRTNLNDRKLGILRQIAPYLDPKNEMHVFHEIKHWTLQVGDKCYELAPGAGRELYSDRKASRIIRPRWINANYWYGIRRSRQTPLEQRMVGQTSKTHDEILAAARDIWTNFNDDSYDLFTQNCQNFVHMLYNRIVANVPRREKASWERMPDPISYRLAEGAQLGLAKSIKIWHLIHMAKMGSAIAGKGLGAAGTVGATSSHVGFGAKAAGLMHHGGVVKVAAFAAHTHPVPALLVGGIMAYLASHGKRSKRWEKKNPEAEEEEDVDVFEMLVAENAVLGQPEFQTQNSGSNLGHY